MFVFSCDSQRSAIAQNVAAVEVGKSSTVKNYSKPQKPRKPRRRVGFAGFSRKELVRHDTIRHIDQLTKVAQMMRLPTIANENPIKLDTETKPDIKDVSSSQSSSENLSNADPDATTVRLKLETLSPVAVDSLADSSHKPSVDGFSPFGQISDTVPHAADWSVQQVFEYFCDFFPSASRILLDMEIDGTALLLFKRSDMLKLVKRQTDAAHTQEALDLGTALKMYAHMLRLQTRNNDVRLSWNCEGCCS